MFFAGTKRVKRAKKSAVRSVNTPNERKPPLRALSIRSERVNVFRALVIMINDSVRADIPALRMAINVSLDAKVEMIRFLDVTFYFP
jgi:hypothetical protein